MSGTLINKNAFSMLNSDSESDGESSKVDMSLNNNNNKQNKFNKQNKSQKLNKNKHNVAQEIKEIKHSEQNIGQSQTNLSNSAGQTEQVNNVEDEMFKQYYGKKTITHINKNNKNYNSGHNTFQKDGKKTNEDDGFVRVVSRKRDERVVSECLIKPINDEVLELQMDNYFRVLAHHNDDKSWDYNSYYNITTLKKWGEMGTFFNTLNNVSGECSYMDFDIFIMKNEISPMWEDTENRNGSICSIKIDSLPDGYGIFKNLTVNMANNTLLKFNPSNWNSINGISFSSKKMDNATETYCIIVKIWFKINILNFGSIDKLLNDDVSNLISKYSVKSKPIKPEY